MCIVLYQAARYRILIVQAFVAFAKKPFRFFVVPLSETTRQTMYKQTSLEMHPYDQNSKCKRKKQKALDKFIGLEAKYSKLQFIKAWGIIMKSYLLVIKHEGWGAKHTILAISNKYQQIGFSFIKPPWDITASMLLYVCTYVCTSWTKLIYYFRPFFHFCSEVLCVGGSWTLGVKTR